MHVNPEISVPKGKLQLGVSERTPQGQRPRTHAPPGESVHGQLPATDGQARRAQEGPAEAPKELVQEVPTRSSSHLLSWGRMLGSRSAHSPTSGSG